MHGDYSSRAGERPFAFDGNLESKLAPMRNHFPLKSGGAHWPQRYHKMDVNKRAAIRECIDRALRLAPVGQVRFSRDITRVALSRPFLPLALPPTHSDRRGIRSQRRPRITEGPRRREREIRCFG